MFGNKFISLNSGIASYDIHRLRDSCVVTHKLSIIVVLGILFFKAVNYQVNIL